MSYHDLETILEKEEQPNEVSPVFTRQEIRKITTSAVLMGLLFAGIISLGLILTVLFMVFVWF